MKFPHQLTLWEFVRHDGFGLPVFNAPVVNFTRWEDKTELFYDNYGEEMQSQSVVYLIDKPVIESYIMLGVSVNTDPLIIPSAYKIRGINVISNLSGTRKVVKVWI